MSQYPEPLHRLINAFKRFPGVGIRSAERFARYVLGASPDEARALARAVHDVKEKIRKCKECCNLADSEICSICSDKSRRNDTICVVEDQEALAAIERTGGYRGLYHVLWGHISPIEGKAPGDITVNELVRRAKSDIICEIILALNPTVEGDATALYLAKKLQALDVKVTRLARGIASGADLARANITVLTDALKGRSRL